MTLQISLAGRVALVTGAGRGIGRVGRPDDVAALVAFLVSDANPYVNGQNIAVDGVGA